MEETFYDRIEEMKLLNEKYAGLSNKGVMLAIYGRRRVGKTELVRQFLEKHVKNNKLYFYVDLAEKKVILDSLSKAVLSQLNEDVVFADFESFFEYIIKKSKENKFLLAIDEFQRFLEIAPEFITLMQKYWDLSFKSQKIMVLLVGSSIGMMQKITESKAGALYGRATRIKISPFTYKDFRLMFVELPEEEKIMRYAVFGGTPFYLEKTKGYDDTLKAIYDLILMKDSELSEEPKKLLEYENIRTHARYNSIMQAISSGKDILKEINDFTQITNTTLPAYLNRLDQLLDLIEKNEPILGKEKLRRYRLKDNFFRFWHKFIFENQSALNLGRRDYVFDLIKNDINGYVGRIFEDVVKELLIHHLGKNIHGHKINFENIGSWWDRNRNEIDILAYNQREKKLLVGEVKWSLKPVGIDVLEGLMKKSRQLNIGGEYSYLLVSKAGFTAECIKKMQDYGVLYLSLKDISELFDELNG